MPQAGVVNSCVTADEGILVYDATDTVNGMLTNADTATRAYIDDKITALVGGAPEALDSLAELASALSSNPDYIHDLSNKLDDHISDPIFAGPIVGVTGANVIPFYYDNIGDFPSASTYHGAIAHSHEDGAMYFAHGGTWVQLQNEGDGYQYLGHAMGIPEGDLNMGNFTGSTVSDNITVKEVLQELETAHDSVAGIVSNTVETKLTGFEGLIDAVDDAAAAAAGVVVGQLIVTGKHLNFHID